jgi:hypothetical protein
MDNERLAQWEIEWEIVVSTRVHINQIEKGATPPTEGASLATIDVNSE